MQWDLTESKRFEAVGCVCACEAGTDVSVKTFYLSPFLKKQTFQMDVTDFIR